MGAKLAHQHFLPDLVSQSFFALWRLSYRQCCDDPGESLLDVVHVHALTLHVMLNASKSPQATGIRHSRSHVRIAHKVHPQLPLPLILLEIMRRSG